MLARVFSLSRSGKPVRPLKDMETLSPDDTVAPPRLPERRGLWDGFQPQYLVKPPGFPVRHCCIGGLVYLVHFMLYLLYFLTNK